MNMMGLENVAVVSDGLFSGTTIGASYVGHVPPEAFGGRPIAVVKNDGLKKQKEKNGGSLHIFFGDWRPYYSEAILKFFGQPAQPERKGMRGHCPKP